MPCSCTLLSVTCTLFHFLYNPPHTQLFSGKLWHFLPVLLTEPKGCLALTQGTYFYEIATTFHGTGHLV